MSCPGGKPREAPLHCDVPALLDAWNGAADKIRRNRLRGRGGRDRLHIVDQILQDAGDRTGYGLGDRTVIVDKTGDVAAPEENPSFVDEGLHICHYRGDRVAGAGRVAADY